MGNNQSVNTNIVQSATNLMSTEMKTDIKNNCSASNKLQTKKNTFSADGPDSVLSGINISTDQTADCELTSTLMKISELELDNEQFQELKEDINLEDTLFDKLEIDSIDLVDILFELETLYDIELKISDIELKAKKELGDVQYEIDGVITAEGIESLKQHMSEINPEKLTEGLTINELIQLFSIHSLCKLVLLKLEDM